MALSRLAQVQGTVSPPSGQIPFVYDPLSDNTVRLLKVLSIEPQIVIVLVDHQLHDSPEYYAVSYSWGTEAATATIICNTRSFHVTPHLYEGLQSITTVMGCQNLWIDAICIDQHNEAEKARQVSNMHQIYVRAKGVLVWLGKAEDDSDYAMSSASRFSTKVQELSMPDTFKAITRPTTPYVLPEFDGRSILAFWHFCARSWFRRLWTYQEAVLANEIFLLCGFGMISWAILAKVARALTRTNRIAYIWSQLDPSEDAEKPLDRGSWVDVVDVEKMRGFRAKNGSINFIKAIQHCRLRKTTEAIDRIYGLFGLCEGRWSAYPAEIPIDYSNDSKARYWNLYSKFGKLALTREPRLELLKMTTSIYRPQGLPSWCPNLHSPPDAAILPGDYAAGWPQDGCPCHTLDSNKDFPCENAHPAFQQMSDRYVSVSPYSNCIHIWGSLADVIVTVGPRYPGDAIPTMARLPVIREYARRLVAWADESVNLAKTANKASGCEVLEAAAMLHHNTPTARQLKAYHLSRMYRDWLNQQDVTNWPQKSPFSDEELSMVIEYVSNLSSIWPGRAVFTTAKGRVGLASSCVEHGDKLCVLYSGPTIYLLRENSVGGTHEFVSDGCAHGLMKGEVFGLMHNGEAKEQLFVIE